MERVKNLSKFVNILNDEEKNNPLKGSKNNNNSTGLSKNLQDAYSFLASGNPGKKEWSKSDYKVFERLENQLLDNVLKQRTFSNFADPYVRTWYRCSRNALLIQVLIRKERRYESRPIMIYTLRTALRYHHTSSALVLCHRLMEDASLLGHKKNFEKYLLLENGLLAKFNAELKADGWYDFILGELHHKYSYTIKLRRFINYAFSEVKKLLKKYKTHILQICYWRIAYRHFIMQKKPLEVLKIYYDYKQYIGENPHLTEESKIAEFALYALDACIELRDIKAAKEFQSVCTLYYKRYSVTRYTFLDVLFLISLHSRDYSGALKIYTEATKSALFKKLNYQRVEKWHLYNAYLRFILSASGDTIKINPLKLINNLPTYSTDKRGFNFPILIGEFVCILKGDFYNELFAFRPKFSLYVKRYVSLKKHYRTWYFSKLILLLYKYEFEAEKCKAIGEKFYKRLLDFRKRNLCDDEMPEIVPYEDLWLHVINFLEQKG